MGDIRTADRIVARGAGRVDWKGAELGKRVNNESRGREIAIEFAENRRWGEMSGRVLKCQRCLWGEVSINVNK
jgi:hypothetical protein